MKYVTPALMILLMLMPPLYAMGQSGEARFAPLREAAEKTNSTAIVVYWKGQKVLDYRDGSSSEPINTMSMTKSIVALAFAKLLAEGTLDSIDTPVAKYYPEWKQGHKKHITVRHLLNHTSGLQNVPNASMEIHPSPNVRRLALSASVVSPPGATYRYNNKAVNILPGIVRRATGRDIVSYMDEHLFHPMGIESYTWKTDEAGNYLAMSGLRMQPADVAKIGRMVLQKGRWEGRQLLPEARVEQLLERGSEGEITHGLLWWRLPEKTEFVISKRHIEKMEQAGFREAWVRRMARMKGHYEARGELLARLKKQFGREDFPAFRRAVAEKQVALWEKSQSGPIKGYEARGWLGQRLVIYPGHDLVAVRMVRASESYDPRTDSFDTFSRMVLRLATEGERDGEG